MTHYATDPLERLYERLSLLGKALGVVCCLWIAVVGTVLIRDLSPDDLKHHRAPQVQERVGQCEGDYARRYACAETILVDGGQEGASAVLLRLCVTLFLPGVAWFMWRGVMTRAEQLRTMPRHSWDEWPARVLKTN